MINDVLALVDTGATNSFIACWFVERIGLEVIAIESMVKRLNKLPV